MVGEDLLWDTYSGEQLNEAIDNLPGLDLLQEKGFSVLYGIITDD